MSRNHTFVLGGARTDFARNWTREGTSIADGLRETVEQALGAARVGADEIEVGHVGNFAAEIYLGQGHLGGLLVEAHKEFAGLPTSRHEGACASGSLALLAATADLEAGRYDVAIVAGVEVMRNLPPFESQSKLAAGAWVPQETEHSDYPWVDRFSELAADYDRRYGLDYRHLAAIAEQNFRNAKENPFSQTRGWSFPEGSFTDDDALNPVLGGTIRRQDSSQISDGAAVVVLATPAFAERWAQRSGTSLDATPRISGWGHHTSRMTMRDKLADAVDEAYAVPHVRATITDAYRRAGVSGVADVDVLEVHDCFSITEYMLIDHLGITEPGQAWQAVEAGVTAKDGATPVNPSGGLIGGGHPVGASGVRMLLDVSQQVTGDAGGIQVEGAKRGMTVNIGGSATTTVSFVVETAA